MSNIVKTHIYLSETIEEDDFSEMLEMREVYKKIKNYVLSRYGGIKGYEVAHNQRKLRDEWTHNKFYEQWDLPARYWKMAVWDACRDLTNMWKYVKKEIRKDVARNESLDDDTQHFMFYALKSKKIFKSVVYRTDIEIPKKFEDKEIDLKRITNLLHRYIRKNLPKPRKVKEDTVVRMDGGMYGYIDGELRIGSRVKGERFRVGVNKFPSHSKIIGVRYLEEERKIEIHFPVTTKVRDNTSKKKMGIDIGINKMIVTSKGDVYGESYRELLEEKSKMNHNPNRSKIYSKYLELKRKGDYEKAEILYKNNLGSHKYLNKKRKMDGKILTYIITEINRMYSENEDIGILVRENIRNYQLDKFWKKDTEKLVRFWNRGDIPDWLDFKATINGVTVKEVDPRNTSKECSNCGKINTRDKEEYKCTSCGLEMDADYNASINILKRG